MAAFKTLDDYDLSGKRVLVRADLNVPVADGKVTDATRIERLLPTLKEIVAKGGKAIILSHFGRPKGKVDPEFSLEQVLPSVADLIDGPVGFVPTDWVDVADVKQAIDEAPAGSILVLENTRFHPGEEANDVELSKRMASLGDIYESRAFKQHDRAAAYFERSFQWRKGVRTDAIMRAAYIYDRLLNERSKAIELYREELQNDTEPVRMKEAEKRLAELTSRGK